MKKHCIKIIFVSCSFIATHFVQAQIFRDPSKPLNARVNDFISRLTPDEKIDQLMNATPAIPRLNVPSYNWWNEALHGVARSGMMTVFPQAIGEAATFDPALLSKVSSAISSEARAQFNIDRKRGYEVWYGGLSFWTPNINIFRDPRWGRGQETYGEDPYLTSQMGVAFVKGLQGNDPNHLKTQATAKHFAVHSGPEKLRHGFNVNVSKLDLYETYLPAFHALVKAGVESVMAAYNSVNGEPASASGFLLDTILRKDWGFKGHVVSDCDAVDDIYHGHKATASLQDAAVWAIKYGLDLNCGNAFGTLHAALKAGAIKESVIDSALANVTRTRIKLGLFDPVGTNPYDKIGADEINSEAHRALARKAAQESIVMLKNDGVLPLKNDLPKYYVTGPNASTITSLIGNYYGINDKMSTILEGIAGHVAKGSQVQYKQGILLNWPNSNPEDWTTGDAKQCDIIFAVLGIDGTIEGEEGDALASPTFGDRMDYNLPKNQIEFLKKLRDGYKGKIVTIITGGSPMNLQEVHQLSDAVLLVWYPGEEGGNAVGDVVFGDVSPSGKLPVTFPMSLDDLPAYTDYSMKGRTYRYMGNAPMYPFGFGLSYAKFEYSNITIDKKSIHKNESFEVKVAVTNQSNVASDEVVQLYISAPQQNYLTPLYSLKGFQRISLKPNESKTLNFTVTPEKMQIINENGDAVIPNGTYKVYIGGSSPVARSRELGAPAMAETNVVIN
ncbi:glycosyl hydrolase [Arachidicoccus ginsenosidimutans]|uniref:glycoside hydrolase family 3 N-terminal domain-containing protein n=1 Tax=Arachidicoccus sp. BS20 TaxID=1850526 RepID=UPI0007F09C92|nr:glycoside hydrolase family 3 N-terminal domain-containing protein [Arachidicoccus sp. BS20]ANI88786.1 glycosyl hydrolase [Arachidicoccus sp. BS20]